MSNRHSSLWRQRITESNVAKKTTHGMTAKRQRPPEYQAWRSMKKRCFLKTDPNYGNYGGRGITVCERWLGKDGFNNFVTDLGARPGSGYSLGRIDNDGHYESSNCRWETAVEQCRNRRSNVRYAYEGEMLTIPELSERSGIPVSNLQLRLIANGWSVERSTRTPVAHHGQQKSHWECDHCPLEWKWPVKAVPIPQCPNCGSSSINRKGQ